MAVLGDNEQLVLRLLADDPQRVNPDDRIAMFAVFEDGTRVDGNASIT